MLPHTFTLIRDSRSTGCSRSSSRPITDILLTPTEHDRHIHDFSFGFIAFCSRPGAHPPPRVPASRHERLERVIPRPAAECAVGVIELGEGAAVAERKIRGLEGGEGGVCDACVDEVGEVEGAEDGVEGSA